MTREIKFRAWDGKRMHYWDSTDHGATDQITGTPYPKLFYLPMSWLVGDSNDWEWMQYTGLEDKNGFEIYEGDSFRFRERRFFVRWDRYRWRFYNKKGGQAFSQIFNHQDEIEVIGNIYQNPELLTKE